jgi:ketol-acid reductoisomerase
MSAIQAVTVADIAIIGLGEVGERFLEEMLRLKTRGIRIISVAETEDTPGRRRAVEEGIQIQTLDEIVTKSSKVDVIFDLTGEPSLRRILREKMIETGNKHTIIAPETMARLLWAIVTDDVQTEPDPAMRGY